MYFYQLCFVNGDSMYPTLKDKQIVLIKKYNLNLANNDIIVIKKNKKTIIKRLIGLPNDTIKIDKYVYVNGNKNDEIITQEQEKSEFFLKTGEYFVLGDNRDESIDSRFDEIGIIYEDEIIGKVIN